MRFSAYPVYLFISAATALAFALYATLATVYRVQVAGLDPLQLVLLGTALELSVFVFEVPTGLVADLYSRKLSVLLGFALIGLGFMLEGWLPVFGAMLAAQLLWGLGYTFTSGALDAWLSDELGSAAANRAFLRAAQLQLLLGFVGIGLATLLGSFYLGLPLLVAGALYLMIALALVWLMPETGFKPDPQALGRPLADMRRSLAAGLELVRRKPVILSIFIITALLGASSETYDRLSEAHLLANIGLPGALTPAQWFGLIAAGSSLLALAVTELLRRRVALDAHLAVARALLGLYLLLSAAVVGFGLAGNFVLALACYGSVRLLRVASGPLQRAWLNQSLEPKTRATVFSLNGQMDALGQIAGGPLLGALARGLGMPLAFVLAGALLLPASALVLRSLGTQPKVEQELQG